RPAVGREHVDDSARNTGDFLCCPQRCADGSLRYEYAGRKSSGWFGHEGNAGLAAGNGGVDGSGNGAGTSVIVCRISAASAKIGTCERPPAAALRAGRLSPFCKGEKLLSPLLRGTPRPEGRAR